ncbi:hypothetical protein [Methanobrevibacter sp.]
MTNFNTLTVNRPQPEEVEKIDIDFLLSDVMIIKAESLKDRKIFNYASCLEKQLIKIKNREAILDLGVSLK